jgi:hypothetical protein
LNASVRADGQAMIMTLDGAFDLSVDGQILAGNDLTLHRYVLS